MFQRATSLGAAATRPTPSERKAGLRVIHRAFAAEALRLTGMTQKALAEAAGFDRTVLSRLFSDRYDNVLSPLNIEKICALTGQPMPGAQGGGATTKHQSLPDPTRGIVRRDAPDALPYAANDDVDLDGVVAAIVGHRTECDPWMVATDALAVVGLRHGDVVFVDRAVAPVDGDLVFVQLYNWDQTWAGSILRILDHGRLVLPWTGPGSPEPIETRGTMSANVAIMGPVVQSFRPRRHAQIDPAL